MPERHIHKYRRLKTTKDKPYWRCMLAGCSHILYQDELIVGRSHLCWMCNQPMIIDQLNALQAKPVCDDCKEDRKARKERMRKIS